MASTILSAAFLFAAAAEAFNYKPARATVLPEIPGDAMTPKPTSPPELRRRLFNRDVGTTVFYAPDNTCGYMSGNQGMCLALFFCFLKFNSLQTANMLTARQKTPIHATTSTRNVQSSLSARTALLAAVITTTAVASTCRVWIALNFTRPVFVAPAARPTHLPSSAPNLASRTAMQSVSMAAPLSRFTATIAMTPQFPLCRPF